MASIFRQQTSAAASAANLLDATIDEDAEFMEQPLPGPAP